ncbi:MAG: NAD(P)H-binding protein [Bacteroidota bacterium]
MESDLKKAIVLGATGLVGGKLVQLLVQDDRYKNITILTRSAPEISHPKLKVVLGNLMQMESFEKELRGDELYCCIGTTKAKTPNKAKYKAIDYGIPVGAANYCKKNGIPTFIAISALGADPRSAIFYSKIKGEMERDIIALGIAKTHMVQPALIGGDRSEKRAGEHFFKELLGALDPVMIGPFKKFRMILPETIAKAMVYLANTPYDQTRVASADLEILGNNGTA